MQEKQDNCALKNQSQLMCHSYADKGGSTPFSSSDRLKTACWVAFYEASNGRQTQFLRKVARCQKSVFAKKNSFFEEKMPFLSFY